MKKKTAKIGMRAWVLFYLLLGLALLWGLNKAGVFSGKVMISIKEKLFPFS